MKKSYIFETKIGWIKLCELNGVLLGISFNHQKLDENENIKESESIEETPLLLEASKQIESYLRGDRDHFNLPYQAHGTVFQKKIWKILEEIPYGETWSYKQVAEKAGNPKAARAVGMANNRNPLSIIIPCHRVIGSNGCLVGYGGGLEIKKILLDLENQHK